ncbi:type II glyceraldehyde-3-phosphate dehydrogenase [Desulfurococcaceae archaeon MEX13E-LK6-19]|nr:type II glyceraldehyde-3-phosphate dehydrogenase [Desulfurococcaceae archaeon MEX13E-LK6-19]
MSRIRVGVNGYGTIGKRVAEAVAKQPDMELVGVVKVTPDYGYYAALANGFKVYTISEKIELFKNQGLEVAGTIEDLLEQIDVIVDATPGGYGEKYKSLYRKYGVKMVFQGGEKPSVADVSFNALCNYDEAVGKESVRVVSCNTTGLLRIICSLNNVFGVEKVRAVIIRRASDPKEIKRGPVNAIVPDPVKLPSHHGLDVKTILPWLDIITSAVIVPTTLMHVHIVNIVLKNEASIGKIIEVLDETPRIVLVDSMKTGIKSTAEIIEYARDLGRKRYDVPELVVWRDSIHVNGRELLLIQAVHQEAIVVPENIDAIRALTGLASDPWESIKLTDDTLGIGRRWF